MEVSFSHFCGGNGKIVPIRHPGHTLVSLTGISQAGPGARTFRLKARLSFTVGGGFEIAATSFHPTNHMPILSIGSPSEAVGRNPRFQINLVRTGK
jgi:hypothetical protein